VSGGPKGGPQERKTRRGRRLKIGNERGQRRGGRNDARNEKKKQKGEKRTRWPQKTVVGMDGKKTGKVPARRSIIHQKKRKFPQTGPAHQQGAIKEVAKCSAA